MNVRDLLIAVLFALLCYWLVIAIVGAPVLAFVLAVIVMLLFVTRPPI